MTLKTLDEVREIAQQLRVDSIRCSTEAGSGHPTSSMSAADVMAVLLARHFRYDWDKPDEPSNDHLIFSKGHASPLLYSMFKVAGVVSDDELVKTYRQFGSRLQGHPTPVLPWVDVATGSLGQGLPDGVGVALAGKYLDELPYRVWVLCGDSEMAEGSIWEAFDKAAYYGLDNLTAIMDVNRLGQRGPTELGWDPRRLRGAGRGLRMPRHRHRRPRPGRDREGPREPSRAQGARRRSSPARSRAAASPRSRTTRTGTASLSPPSSPSGRSSSSAECASSRPADRFLRADPRRPARAARLTLPSYAMGDESRRGRRSARRSPPSAPVRTWWRSTPRSGTRRTPRTSPRPHPERYFEMFIAEQQLVAAAVGLSVRGYVAVRGDLRCLLHPRVRLHQDGGDLAGRLRLCGSHAGVEIGADGPSQMALEDLAMIRAVHGSTVLYPSDGTSTAALVKAMAETSGVVYMRTTEARTRSSTAPTKSSPSAAPRCVRSSPDDSLTLVGAGVTLHNCLAAADQLAADGIHARVVDLYSVKPVDAETLVAALARPAGAWLSPRTTTPRAASAAPCSTR